MFVYEPDIRYTRKRIPELKKVTGAKDVLMFLEKTIANEPIERFVCFYMNPKNEVLYEIVSTGTVDQTSVYVREIAKNALFFNATRVIVAHNHPSGDMTPSKADHLLTVRLKDALKLFDIELLDHVIVGGDKYYSFNDSGLL